MLRTPPTGYFEDGGRLFFSRAGKTLRVSSFLLRRLWPISSAAWEGELAMFGGPHFFLQFFCFSYGFPIDRLLLQSLSILQQSKIPIQVVQCMKIDVYVLENRCDWFIFRHASWKFEDENPFKKQPAFQFHGMFFSFKRGPSFRLTARMACGSLGVWIRWNWN